MMPELEFIRVARYISTPISLIALAVILGYLITSLIGRIRAKSKGRLTEAVFTKLWILLLVVVGIVGGLLLVPSLLSETLIRGVVLDAKTGTTVKEAWVSIDGYPELKAETGKDGNFQITIPTRKRQDSYVVRVQETIRRSLRSASMNSRHLRRL